MTGNTQAATLAAQLSSLDRAPQLGPRPISDLPQYGNAPVPARAGAYVPAPPSIGGVPMQRQQGPGINPLFAALRDMILQRTQHPEPLNQRALFERFLGGVA